MKRFFKKIAIWFGFAPKEKSIDELLSESIKKARPNLSIIKNVDEHIESVKGVEKLPKDYNFKQNLNTKFNNSQTVYRNSLGRFASKK